MQKQSLAPFTDNVPDYLFITDLLRDLLSTFLLMYLNNIADVYSNAWYIWLWWLRWILLLVDLKPNYFDSWLCLLPNVLPSPPSWLCRAWEGGGVREEDKFPLYIPSCLAVPALVFLHSLCTLHRHSYTGILHRHTTQALLHRHSTRALLHRHSYSLFEQVLP